MENPVRPAWRGIVFLLGCFAGLCTLFAATATAFDAWRDHIHGQWPTAQARLSRCELRDYRGSGKSWYIHCHLAFTVAHQDIDAQVSSGMVADPSRVIYASPGYPDLGDLQAWVDTHPAGSPVQLHYDPADPAKVELLDTDMPLKGSHTPNNLRLLGAFALASLLLLLIGLTGRRVR